MGLKRSIDAAARQLGAHPGGDDHDAVGPLEHQGLERAGHAVTRRALVGRAVIHRRVLPERAGLVDHREAQAAARPERRKPVEHRGVGVDDGRLLLPGHRGDTAGHAGHLRDLPHVRHPRRATGGHRGPVVDDAADLLALGSRPRMLRRGEHHRVETQRPLEAHDAEAPRAVAAQHRQRVVEDVEDLHPM
jgi:hypothetical protein